MYVGEIGSNLNIYYNISNISSRYENKMNFIRS